MLSHIGAYYHVDSQSIIHKRLKLLSDNFSILHRLMISLVFFLKSVLFSYYFSLQWASYLQNS